jgi:predicted alpha/beta hydrolase family esterase
VIITVPGLRGRVDEHWQTWLAARRPDVVAVPPLGRDNPSLADRVAALNETVEIVGGPVIIVAHSAGVLTTAHWAARHRAAAGLVLGALLATPPDLGSPLPAEYPSLAILAHHGWLPIPRERLPFPSIVAASANDALGDPQRVRALADAWGSRWHDLGAVGHLNPASGYGEWPYAEVFIEELSVKEAPDEFEPGNASSGQRPPLSRPRRSRARINPAHLRPGRRGREPGGESPDKPGHPPR